MTNSGCANACTGPQGMLDAREMAVLAADRVGCAPSHALVASTGVIGVNLKMDAVRSGIPAAVAALSRDGHADAARAIMTTDPFPKAYAVEVTSLGGRFRVGGMAKGLRDDRAADGHHARLPDDRRARSTPRCCGARSSKPRRYTFNAITVDGESSTNDCVFALASGDSGVRIDEELYAALFEGLRAVALELSLGIVRGGEGATKLIAITVSGARRRKRPGRRRASSPTRRSSRPPCTAAIPTGVGWSPPPGAPGVTFALERAVVRIGPLVLFSDGQPHDELAPQAADYLQRQGDRDRSERRCRRQPSRDDVHLRSVGRVRARSTPNTARETVRQPDCGARSDATWAHRCEHSTTFRESRCKDFLSILDFSHEELRQAIALATRLKRERSLGLRAPTAHALDGRHIGLLFEKPSLRTRVTFTIGVRELGGDMVEIPADVMHADREPVHDVARNLERWVDARRHPHVQSGAPRADRRDHDAAARHQRAVGRTAPVSGAGRHADALGALGDAGRAARWRSSATATTSRRRWCTPR